MTQPQIQLQLENTSTCNAKCSFCVYPKAERWGGLMSMSLFKKILDEAEGISSITQVCITGLGEPTLDPMLIQRVRYAREKKPEAFIDMFTNGVYLTPERFEALQEAGLSAVQVSLNAVRAEQHEKVMGLVGKFDIVCQNLEFARLNSRGCDVEVRAVINGDQFSNEDGFEFYKKWGIRNRNGIGQLIREGNWAGDSRTVRKFMPNEACFRALGQIYVTFDGKVTACCFDPTGKVVFGDLNTQTLREIYSEPTYVAFREAHHRDRADIYPICAGCTRI